MKLVSVIQFITISFFIGYAAQAATFGTPIISGTGCPTTDRIFAPVKNQPNRYSLADQITLAKSISPTILRKTCQLRLPVQLGAKEKLVVSEVAQYVRLNASRGATVKTSLEVFLAGGRSNPLTSELKAVSAISRSTQVLQSRGIVAESACGGEVILGSNLSAVALGDARATIITGDVQLNLEIKTCQN